MLEVTIWYHRFPNELENEYTCIALIDEDRSFSSTMVKFKQANENLDKAWNILKGMGFYQYFNSIAYLIRKGATDRKIIYEILSNNGVKYEPKTLAKKD